MDDGAVLAELIDREPIFHRGGCSTHEEFLALTAEDFVEVGASGARYSRDFVWSVLEKRIAQPSEDVWRADEFELHRIAESTYLLTYLLDQSGRRSRRSTIWQCRDGNWVIIYHQGTLLD